MLNITTEMKAAFENLDNNYKLLLNPLLTDEERTSVTDKIKDLEETLTDLGSEAHSHAMWGEGQEGYFDYEEEGLVVTFLNRNISTNLKGHPFEFKARSSTWRCGLNLFAKRVGEPVEIRYKGLVIKRC